MKESIIVPVARNAIKRTNNYREISLLSTSYKVLLSMDPEILGLNEATLPGER
jgi:hypothetical protein